MMITTIYTSFRLVRRLGSTLASGTNTASTGLTQPYRRMKCMSAAGKLHLARLHELPCVVTLYMEGRKEYGVVVHHLESIRDDLSDFAAVPMTEYWHKELHRLSRRGFETRTKLTDIDLLALTIKLLMVKER